jgi:D-alanine transaminase
MTQIKGVFNGSFDIVDNIKVSPFSRAYTFSDSVYEVVPFFNSKPIAFEAHLKRLEFSSSELSISLNLEKISNEITTLISTSGFSNGYVYYQVTRGVDALRSHMHESSLEIETFGYVKAHLFEWKPLKVSICDDIRWNRCDIKSTSLLGNVMNMNSARKNNCDEVIMHKDGLLTEAGASNLFFVIDETICTPALNGNILPGITRALLIDELKANSIKVLEEDFSLDDLSKATCAWLTSSTKGLAPISEIVNLESNLDIYNLDYKSSEEIFNKKFLS